MGHIVLNYQTFQVNIQSKMRNAIFVNDLLNFCLWVNIYSMLVTIGKSITGDRHSWLTEEM